MEIYKLQQLLSEMSLQEKIGQMVQLTGAYFDKDAVLTGVVGEQLPPEWIIRYAGSVLGVIGKEKIYGTTPTSYSSYLYGGCDPWMPDNFSDSVGTGLVLSSGAGFRGCVDSCLGSLF